MDVHQLERQHRSNDTGAALIIDVRTPAEYESIHIEGSLLMPLDALDPEALKALRREHPGEDFHILCRTGKRAATAIERLQRAGIDRIVLVDGGIVAWTDAGYAVRQGRQTLSLERQVRIAAGALVVVGAVLGAFLNPAWIALSAFVGAGLVFAGATDTCAMGLMLARLPWNRAGAR